MLLSPHTEGLEDDRRYGSCGSKGKLTVDLSLS